MRAGHRYLFPLARVPGRGRAPVADDNDDGAAPWRANGWTRNAAWTMRFQINDMTGAVSEGGAAVRVAAASMHEPAFVAAGHLKRASVQPLGCARPRGAPSRDGVNGRRRPPGGPCSPLPQDAPRTRRCPAGARPPRKSRPWRARPPCARSLRFPPAQRARATSPDGPVRLAALAPHAATHFALRSSCSAASRRSSMDWARERNAGADDK